MCSGRRVRGKTTTCSGKSGSSRVDMLPLLRLRPVPAIVGRVLSRFGDFRREPLPDGRGSVTVALISQGLLSRERKRAGVFPRTVEHPLVCADPLDPLLGRLSQPGRYLLDVGPRRPPKDLEQGGTHLEVSLARGAAALRIPGCVLDEVVQLFAQDVGLIGGFRNPL